MTNILVISNQKGGVARTTACLSLGVCLAEMGKTVLLIDLVKLVREKTNARLAYCVWVTMYDRRNKICHVILEQMQASLSAVLFKTTIEVDTGSKKAPPLVNRSHFTRPTRGALNNIASSLES